MYLFQKAQNKITLPRLFSSLINQGSCSTKPQREEVKEKGKESARRRRAAGPCIQGRETISASDGKEFLSIKQIPALREEQKLNWKGPSQQKQQGKRCFSSRYPHDNK